jgi:hypothetical protein
MVCVAPIFNSEICLCLCVSLALSLSLSLFLSLSLSLSYSLSFLLSFWVCVCALKRCEPDDYKAKMMDTFERFLVITDNTPKSYL